MKLSAAISFLIIFNGTASAWAGRQAKAAAEMAAISKLYNGVMLAGDVWAASGDGLESARR